MEVTYSLTELSSLTGVPQRKIRWYISQRLVPKPIGKGRKSRYGEAHLATLQVIVRLREARLPLNVIREYLRDSDPTSVRAMDSAPLAAGQESAGDAAVDAEVPSSEDVAPGGPFRGLSGPQLAVAVLAFVAKKRESAATAIHKAAHRGGSQAVASQAGGEDPAAAVADKSSCWQRFSLSPDVELHVRTSYLACLADSCGMADDGPLTSDQALGIVLDGLAATEESGAPRTSSAPTSQRGDTTQAPAASPRGAGVPQGAHSDTKTEVLVHSVLVTAAAERRTMRYADVASLMGIATRGQSMGTKVGSLLDGICEDEVRHGRPMLSALVVGYTGRPGKGFFSLAQALGRLEEGDDQAAFWARELEALFETWQRPGEGS